MLGGFRVHSDEYWRLYGMMAHQEIWIQSILDDKLLHSHNFQLQLHNKNDGDSHSLSIVKKCKTILHC